MSSTRIWFSPHLDSLIATGIRLIFLDSFLANLSFLLAFSQLNLFLIIIHNTYIYIYISFCFVALMLLLSFSTLFSSCFFLLPFRSSYIFLLRLQHSPSLSLSLFFLNKDNKLRRSTPLLIEENPQATRSEIHLSPVWIGAIKRMIQTRYIYIRRVDQRLMNDDDITREMHSGRLVGMQQFSDISQTDAANSIYAPLDNLLGGKLDRHRWEIANYRSLVLLLPRSRVEPIPSSVETLGGIRSRGFRISSKLEHRSWIDWAILITDYPPEELEQVCNKEYYWSMDCNFVGD